MQHATTYTAADGIKAYSKLGLQLYDCLVIRGLAPHVWGSSVERFLAHYRQHLTPNHADIGVGTGYFLDRCDFGMSRPRIALIDRKPQCLAYAARRLARYQPETYLCDARQSLRGIQPFDSISLGGVLHCLPGADFNAKASVLNALRSISRPGTKIFGYTLVNNNIHRDWRRAMTHRVLSAMQVVNFTNDNVADLSRTLSLHLTDCTIESVGSFAFFSALVPSKS
jgi:methyltransferase family protein